MKSTTDLGSPLVTQVLGSQLLSAFPQAKALRQKQLASGRDLLVELLRSHLPEWTFSVPTGGLCLWIRLAGYDTRHFTQLAARFGVAVTQGSLFATDDTHNEFLRIPFLLEEEAMTTGVLRLKSAWSEFRATASVETPRAVNIV
jgi:DNA-binding transcriptional MocR family regulator